MSEMKVSQEDVRTRAWGELGYGGGSQGVDRNKHKMNRLVAETAS